jgi:hypothetical protein
MSIKELFQKIFGGIAKLFTAKNGVRNFIILIIALFIVDFIVAEIASYVRDKQQCKEMIENMGWTEKKCEEFKELFKDERESR